MIKRAFIICILTILGLSLEGQVSPKIVFRERIIDFGAVSLSQKDTSLTFYYRNAGGKALSIANMIPTCTCVEPSYSSETLMPGDSSSFSVRLRFSHKGSVSHAVTICYSSPGSTDVDLIRVGIRGEVVE